MQSYLALKQKGFSKYIIKIIIALTDPIPFILEMANNNEYGLIEYMLNVLGETTKSKLAKNKDFTKYVVKQDTPELLKLLPHKSTPNRIKCSIKLAKTDATLKYILKTQPETSYAYIYETFPFIVRRFRPKSTFNFKLAISIIESNRIHEKRDVFINYLFYLSDIEGADEYLVFLLEKADLPKEHMNVELAIRMLPRHPMAFDFMIKKYSFLESVLENILDVSVKKYECLLKYTKTFNHEFIDRRLDRGEFEVAKLIIDAFSEKEKKNFIENLKINYNASYLNFIFNVFNREQQLNIFKTNNKFKLIAWDCKDQIIKILDLYTDFTPRELIEQCCRNGHLKIIKRIMTNLADPVDAIRQHNYELITSSIKHPNSTSYLLSFISYKERVKFAYDNIDLITSNISEPVLKNILSIFKTKKEKIAYFTYNDNQIICAYRNTDLLKYMINLLKN